MAKAILNSLVTAISGKLSGNSKLIFRHNANGTVSVYRQKKHKRKSLHSPAQERQRKLLAMASVGASRILANPDSEEYTDYNEQYIQHCKRTYGKHYYSLYSFITHCLFEKYKNETP